MSNIASTTIKIRGVGEETFTLIPIRRAPEDPMERLLVTKHPNEIKKTIETPEERRKEIEVCVTGVRFLQQKGLDSISRL